MYFKNIPSLSRLLDTALEVEVVSGSVTNLDNLLTVTVSIPTEEFTQLAGEEVENLYLRPMTRALAKKINELGNVKAGKIPMPESKEIVFQCKNGRIPVTLRILRRQQPDRHQILVHALVQPENDNA